MKIMKLKNILFISLLFLFTTIFYSCDRINENDYLIPVGESEWKGQRVLIEDFTGMDCPNCPAAATIAENLQGLFPGRVIVLANHVNRANAGNLCSPDSMTSSVGDEYFSTFFTGPMSLPMGMVNRINFSSNKLLDRSKWSDEVIKQMDQIPVFSLELTALYNSNNRLLTINTQTIPLSDLQGEYSMTVLITQNDIIAPQKDKTGIIKQYIHKHVLRASVTPASGSQLMSGAVEKNVTITKQYTFSVPAKWDKGGFVDMNNCSVIAFISNPATSEILQVAESKVIL